MFSSRGKKQVFDLLRLQEERREAAGEVLSEDVIETVDHKKQRLDKDGRLQIVQVLCASCVLTVFMSPIFGNFSGWKSK